MKEVTKIYTVYEFNELPEDIRQQLINKAIYSDTEYQFRYELIHDNIQEELNHLFPASDLQINLDVSCSQGSGLTFSGSLSCFDVLDRLAAKFTEKEYKTLRFYCSCVPAVKIEENRRYSYYHLTNYTIYDEMQWSLAYDNIRKINDDLLVNFSKLANEYLQEYCWKQYDIANNCVNLLTDADKEAAIEDAAVWLNDNEYLADGSIFYGA